MVVFVCSPCRATEARTMEEHLADADRFAEFAVDQGCFPVTPHLILTRYLDDNDPTERERGLLLAKDALRRCDELWIYGRRISDGMWSEINAAFMQGIPVRHVAGGNITDMHVRARLHWLPRREIEEAIAA